MWTISSTTGLLIAAVCGVSAVPSHAQQREKPASDARPDRTRAPSSSKRPGPATRSEPTAANPARVDIDELAENPSRYAGKTVRVQGEIEELIAPRVLTLDEDSLIATSDVLVILPRAAAAIDDDSEVVVQGTVHQPPRARVERDYGSLNADTTWLGRFDHKPIIVATSLRTLKGADLLVSADASEKERMEAKLTAVEAGAIARAPDRFVGRLMAVKGEIEDVFSHYMFTLDEDELLSGPDVFVITRHPASAIVDGADVRVNGVLQRFNWEQLRSDYSFLGLDEERIRQLEGRPVILADGVWRRPSD